MERPQTELPDQINFEGGAKFGLVSRLGCSDPPLPSPCRPEALGFHGVSAEASVLTKQQAFRRHIKPRPSPALRGSSVQDKRTGAPVSVSSRYETQRAPLGNGVRVAGFAKASRIGWDKRSRRGP
ncbi:hypothetical protein EYF80_027578 [Liparis tanakae]|uniref:Uncharacterized protein n=1 Tax=Liparis tanakae TaxID=230148 RepID=A0A4Z2H8H9_9TELE|nr:hypothetical protein EYF80_027578 [Liparis tanakae]